MSKIQNTINDIAHGLHGANIIDIKTLRDLTDEDLPIVVEYTGEDIQKIRMEQRVSQSVFAKYLNVSPAMIKSLEQGQRHAHGAILKLLNIVERHGIEALI